MFEKHQLVVEAQNRYFFMSSHVVEVFFWTVSDVSMSTPRVRVLIKPKYYAIKLKKNHKLTSDRSEAIIILPPVLLGPYLRS